MTRPKNPIVFIEEQEVMDALLGRLCQESIIALDVETTLDKIPSLCTVQLATRAENYVIDALKIEDSTSLATLMEASSPLKVIHHAPFERRVLARWGISINSVYDTCLQSRRLFPRAKGGHSLLALCRRHLFVELDKTWQTSDWTRRPLLPEQLDYAAMDAEVLVKIYEIFKGQDEEMESRVDPRELKLEDVALALRRGLKRGCPTSMERVVSMLAESFSWSLSDARSVAVLRGFLTAAHRQGIISREKGCCELLRARVEDHRERELKRALIRACQPGRVSPGQGESAFTGKGEQPQTCQPGRRTSKRAVVLSAARVLGFEEISPKGEERLAALLDELIAQGRVREGKEGFEKN